MVFSSSSFLFLFLPAFVFCYLPARSIARQNLVIVAFSLLFYGVGEPLLILVLLGSMAFNYRAAFWIARREDRSRRRATGLAIAANLLLLAIFKYAGFIVGSLQPLLDPLGLAIAPPHIRLPLGISFYTFHAISYLVDVHRRSVEPERSRVNLALYIALFPQLIAGPIVRFKTIAGRIHRRNTTLGRASAGTRIFIIGLAQKVLIADEVARIAEAMFDGSVNPGFAASWLGLVAYGLQIYFDFAGYSNMAIGMGLALGLRLPRNFDLPYRARSITEFWRRWHLSLSAWFRDYVYIPLGGNRGSALATYRNLVVVFLLCGLWHGASWNFVIWGAHHGAFLVLERVGLRRLLDRLPAGIAWAYAMLVVFSGWVWFRAADVAGAIAVFRGLLGLNGWRELSLPLHLSLYATTIGALCAGAAFAILPRGRHEDRRASSNATPLQEFFAKPIVDGAAIAVIAGLAILAVSGGAYSPFLYFRF